MTTPVTNINTPITPTSNPELFTKDSTSSGGASSDSTQINADFNFFLKMLTTQLKNQDPTEPMDVSQMTSQIAQYSGVEQQVKTNSQLEKLLASNKQSELSTAVSYIGKEIETTGNEGSLIRSNGQAQASFSYTLPKEAASAKVTIKDKATGAIVFTGSGTVQEGRNITVWDGKNSSTGEAMPAGTYTISVEAADGAGGVITPVMHTVAIVDGVETDADGNTLLSIGDETVKFEDVLAVRNPLWFGLGGTDTTEGGDDTTTGDNGDGDSGTNPA